MRTKTLLLISLAYTGIFLINPACRKDDTTNPALPEPEMPEEIKPVLPEVPYNYTSVSGTMPLHYRQLLQSNPTFDNTPAGNPVTNDGATLGRVLFYDKTLSFNNKTACASCHNQQHAFSDTSSFSTGFNGGHTRRNSMQLGFLRFFQAKKMFWDARAASLEDQVLLPVTDPVEMGMPSLSAMLEKLNKKSYYPALFEKAFGTPEINTDRVAKALAQFIRSFASFQSRFDKGVDADFNNFTAIELNGLNRASNFCGECHSDLVTIGPGLHPTFLFLGTPPQNNGLDAVYADNGVSEISELSGDKGKFKIPTLRNIELTGPYMHDGRFATLEQVLDHYQSGIQGHPNLSDRLEEGGLRFSQSDRNAILAFLKTLTDHDMTRDVKFSNPFR